MQIKRISADLENRLRPKHRLQVVATLLENGGLCAAIFETINHRLEQRGLLMRKGTLVDATIIHAPSSTKNKDRCRDPGMHQTKKGNQWYFGMKAHIGSDRDSGLVHTVVSTAANKDGHRR